MKSEFCCKIDNTADQRSLLSVLPASVGPRIATPRGGAVHSVRPPGAQTFRTDDHCVAVMLAPSFGMRSAFASNRLQEFDAHAGMLVVSPAGVESRSVWRSTRENITVSIREAQMRELAESEYESHFRELQPIPFGTVDEFALNLAQILKSELGRGTPNELYVDSIITMLGLHILRSYAGQKTHARPTGSLSREQARDVLDYMRLHLGSKITVADLAALCNLSAGYFIKAFTLTFGRPPHQHLIELRLDAAVRLIGEGNLNLSDIALRSGFSSQSHLTAAMRKHRQTTPAKVRRRD